MKGIFKSVCMLALCVLTMSMAKQRQAADEKTVKEFFKKIKKSYETGKDYYIVSGYKSFPTYSSKSAMESYEGIFVKKGNQTYSKIDNTEFVSFNDYFLQIDNESRLMEYRKSESAKKNMSLFDFMRFIDKFSSFEIMEKDGFTIVTLKAGAVTTVPYSRVEIYVDNKTNTIARQVMYMLVQATYTNSNGNLKNDYPRLEVTFSSLNNKNIEKYSPKFNLASYFKVSRGKYTMSNEYKGYSVID